MKRLGWVGLLLGVILFGFLWSRTSRAVETQPSSTRKVAADFRLTDLNGKPVELGALRGKVVLLDFWATWCPPCQAEIPHFKELYTTYKGRGLQVIGVALDQEGEKAVGPFVKENQINYPIALANSKVTRAYGGIRGIPTTFLIDKKGRIAKQFVGYQDKQIFEKEIQNLLAE